LSSTSAAAQARQCGGQPPNSVGLLQARLQSFLQPLDCKVVRRKNCGLPSRFDRPTQIPAVSLYLGKTDKIVRVPWPHGNGALRRKFSPFRIVAPQ